MRKKKEPTPEKLNPRIIEEVNSITGESQWIVWKNGIYTHGASIRPFARTFETKTEAEACFAKEFGWVKVREYQPTGGDDA